MKPRKRQGLCKLPFDAIVKARDDNAAQINRIALTFVGTVVFCALSLLTPDTALLVGGEKLSVPLAGPVSFFGFMLLGPAVLIVLRVYLQIYVEHQRRLDRITQWIPAARHPILTPDKNPLLRSFRGFVGYLLLPLAMLAFWWKASVFPELGQEFFVVLTAVVAMHLTLPLRALSWRLRAVLSLGAAVLAVAVLAVAATMSFEIPFLRRSFNLFRANLSDQWLVSVSLEGANLSYANLSGANLMYANLSGANLLGANLSGANFFGAHFAGAYLSRARLSRAILVATDLSGAELSAANLSGAELNNSNLSGAKLFAGTNLSDADLSEANLSDATLRANLSGANLTTSDGLTQQQLDEACGNEKTRLPSGLSVKFCSQH